MADVRIASAAARRAADSLLRSVGGRSVYLRLPATASQTGINEQLGLVRPEFEAVELSPVVFRRARPQTQATGLRWELMVSATSIDGIVDSTGVSDAGALFGQAAGILVGESLMEIEAVFPSDMSGAPYVYHVILRAPVSVTI